MAQKTNSGEGNSPISWWDKEPFKSFNKLSPLQKVCLVGGGAAVLVGSVFLISRRFSRPSGVNVSPTVQPLPTSSLEPTALEKLPPSSKAVGTQAAKVQEKVQGQIMPASTTISKAPLAAFPTQPSFIASRPPGLGPNLG